MLWFLLKYASIGFALWFAWGLRNYIRKPWAEYVSHNKLNSVARPSALKWCWGKEIR